MFLSKHSKTDRTTAHDNVPHHQFFAMISFVRKLIIIRGFDNDLALHQAYLNTGLKLRKCVKPTISCRLKC